VIDLHTHTTESDGSLSPAELVDRACAIGLEALAISDHDTLAGYDGALERSRGAGLDLVRAIEIGTRHPEPGKPRGQSVHILGYFLTWAPSRVLLRWVARIQAARRERNIRLAARLQELGLDVHLEEAEALGRRLTGRPHFARVLVRKGYVATVEDAFNLYLNESAKAYVPRVEPPTAEAIDRLREGGALPVLAHPFRLAEGNPQREREMIAAFCGAGLEGIEVWHSDHSPADADRFLALARRFDLAVTGGSDFHGEAKAGVRLGTGRNGNLAVPRAVLDQLWKRATSLD
jgi:predicted metal-dependent phosphoesterase TrpH